MLLALANAAVLRLDFMESFHCRFTMSIVLRTGQLQPSQPRPLIRRPFHS